MASEPRKNALGGGCLLTFGILAGVIVGLYYREPSIGFLAGTAAGLLLLLAVWLVDRRRG
jgi:uncharacterized membrane protein (UPF0136 family)